MEFALDTDSDKALGIVERERQHLDQGFFVLAFGALEAEINSLFSARNKGRDAVGNARKVKFEKRLKTALEIAQNVLGAVPPWAAAEKEIESWYEIRSDVAHGDSPAKSFDVSKVVQQANEIATTCERVVQALAAKNP